MAKSQTEQNLYAVLEAIERLEKLHPSNAVPCTSIEQELGLDNWTVQGCLDILEEEGKIIPGSPLGKRVAFLKPKGRMALKDPEYNSTNMDSDKINADISEHATGNTIGKHITQYVTHNYSNPSLSPLDKSAFDHILLEPEQKELLITLVEAARNVTREKREKFFLFETRDNSSLNHPGFKTGGYRAYKGDIEILGKESLVSIARTHMGVLNFDITPLGFRYYAYLKDQLGESVQRVETSIRNFLDAETFQRKCPAAYQKWSEAEKLLWSSDSNQQLTTIGHLCREAIQEFATALVDRYQPLNVTQDKAKTVARIKAVFAMQAEKLGSASKLLEVSIAYWGELSDLIQRQEHGGQKEGQALVWEDGRRVVFYTAIVMFEIDRTLP